MLTVMLSRNDCVCAALLACACCAVQLISHWAQATCMLTWQVSFSLSIQCNIAQLQMPVQVVAASTCVAVCLVVEWCQQHQAYAGSKQQANDLLAAEVKQ